MKTKLAIISTVFLSVGIIYLITLYLTTLNGLLLKWNVDIDLLNYKIKDFHTESTPISQVEKLEAFWENDRVRIERIKTDNHNKYISDKKLLLNSLFLPTTSPYPEVITNIIECPDEFKPEHVKTERGDIYTLFAGERLNYGICSYDLVKYKSFYGIFDCLDKGIFEIRAFSNDRKKAQDIVQSFKC